MANTTIHQLPLASTIDGAQDYLPIYTNSLVATQRINRNTLLGVTGQPADLSTIQTFTNKVLGNTNTITAVDTLFTLQDNLDTTKQARLQLSGITTGTTRTYTLPDVSDTLVTLGATQTLTGKTLTSPTITSPTITNATITADAITGFTNANNGSVYGIAITGSAIQSSAAFADAIILPKALVTGTGSTWVWQSWTPTWTNLTIGNGTLNYAKYVQVGKTINFRVKFTFGSTTVITGQIGLSLPTNLNSDYTSVTDTVTTNGQLNDASSLRWLPWVTWGSSSRADIYYLNASDNLTATSSTAPFTWTTSDQIMLAGQYETP